MIKVGNGKTIKKLAYRTMKANQSRNIIAIFAIALTAILFTTLFTLGIGSVESFQRATIRQSGGDGHAALKYITDEQFDQVKDHKLIKEIAYNRMLSDGILNQELRKRHTELWYMDNVGMRLGFCEPTHGHKPVEENEIITDTKTLKLLGVEQKVGAPVHLTLKIREKEIERDFILAGWWESDPIFNVGMIVTSRAYVDGHQEELKNTYKEDFSLTGAINAYIMFDNSLNLEYKLALVLEDSGFSMNPEARNFIENNVNWAYLSTNFGMDPTTLIAMTAGMILVIVTGYLIIYNIFQISVIRDIRFFGLLKTIGTTGRQIKWIIRRQAMFLSCIGIPIGLIIGFLLGKSFVPLIMNMSNYAGTSISVSPNPLIFIGSGLFALMTILISTYKPGKVAAGVSPVEAAKFTDGSVKNTRKIKNSIHGAKMPRMALSNLGRNKKRTVLVLLSLSLSLVLLNTVFTLSKSIDMDKLLSTFVDTDFLIAHADYFQNKFYGTENQLSESFISDVESQPGFEEGGRLYGGRGQMFTVEDDKTDQDYNMDEKGNYFASVYGLEELPLHRLDLIDGELDFDKLASGKYILEGVHLDDNGVPELENIRYHVGDKVVIHNYLDTTDNDGNREYITEEFIVLGHVAIKYYTNSDRTWGNYTFYLPAKIYKTMVTNPAIMSYAFNIEDKQESHMEQFLKQYTESVEPVMNYDSKYTMMSEFDGLKSSVVIIGGALSVIIGLVGILNFINSILTSILTRRKEFAMLQSIGMTKKQLKQMLCFEGLYYTLGTSILSIVFGVVFSLLVVNGICNLLWFFSYHFILWPILCILPVLMILGFIIPLVSYAATNKQSIVEQLREVE